MKTGNEVRLETGAGRPRLIAAAGLLLAVSLAWALWQYGATQDWALPRVFLALLPAAPLALWGSAGTLLVDRRIQVVVVVGLVLMIQLARLPTLAVHGYLPAAVAWITLFVTLAVALQLDRGAHLLALFLLAVGAGEALLGLAQGLGEVAATTPVAAPAGTVTGTLFNRNHFAGLLNMILPLALAALLGAVGGRRRRTPRSEVLARGWVAVAGCSLLGLAVLLSRSRGGALSLLVTLTLVGTLVLLRRRRAGAGAALAAGAVLLLTLGLGAAVAGEALVSRLDEGAGWRPGLYRDTTRMIADHPLGVGPGMYRWRFRPYQTVGITKRYDHAHNDYLELAADWGIPVAALFWAFVAWRLARSVRLYLSTTSPRRAALALGCAGAICSILVHSLFDFNLHIPGNLMVFATILGLAWSLDRVPAWGAPTAAVEERG